MTAVLLVIAINAAVFAISVVWAFAVGRRRTIYTRRDLRLILLSVPRGRKDWSLTREGRRRVVHIDGDRFYG